MKKFLTVLLFFVFSLNFTIAQDTPDLILFYWETCPHCKNEEKYLEEFKEIYDFNVIWYEVYYNTDNQQLMQEYGERFWESFNGVPVVIMGDDYFLWESYEKTEELLLKYAKKKNTEEEISNTNSFGWEWEGTSETVWKTVVENPSKDEPSLEVTETWNEVENLTAEDENTNETNSTGDIDQTVSVFWKEISLSNVWPIVFWILLWFVDGINPCMFWVLIFLLTYLVSIGSKKKVLYSWLIFVLTTFVLYFAIMYLMHKVIFSTMALLPYIAYIKYAIWIIAIILWIIEIKDFFFYGKGVSLKIPSSVKPMLEYITKKWTYMSAFVLAVLSTCVELPCTIWIPLAYVWAVGESINIFSALAIYNFFFIVPLLIIVFGIYYWLSAFKSDENWNMAINDLSSKKVMRLVAWLILIILWVLFITKVL